jgi:hypothetical protein
VGKVGNLDPLPVTALQHRPHRVGGIPPTTHHLQQVHLHQRAWPVGPHPDTGGIGLARLAAQHRRKRHPLVAGLGSSEPGRPPTLPCLWIPLDPGCSDGPPTGQTGLKVDLDRPGGVAGRRCGLHGGRRSSCGGGGSWPIGPRRTLMGDRPAEHRADHHRSGEHHDHCRQDPLGDIVLTGARPGPLGKCQVPRRMPKRDPSHPVPKPALGHQRPTNQRR